MTDDLRREIVFWGREGWQRAQKRHISVPSQFQDLIRNFGMTSAVPESLAWNQPVSLASLEPGGGQGNDQRAWQLPSQPPSTQSPAIRSQRTTGEACVLLVEIPSARPSAG
uniref:Uncharacterized protein n=1 Tax=Plectus sambesii TaxID=2011161 RepID=A0A914VAR8_9BILA